MALDGYVVLPTVLTYDSDRDELETFAIIGVLRIKEVPQ
jgi:hypothetical protein